MRPATQGVNVGLIVAIVFGFFAVSLAMLAAFLYPVFSQAKTAAKRTSTLSNGKQLAIATLIYATDQDDKLPHAMGDPAKYVEALRPYLKSDELWKSLNPAGGRFEGVGAVSGKKTTSFKEPSKQKMLFESESWSPRNDRVTAFIDGSVRFKKD